jgi:hypothetical protein
MDDNTVTAVHICSIIPCSLTQGSLMVLVLVEIVSPVYLRAVCSQFTHTSCTLTGHYVICRLCSSNSILNSAQYFGHWLCSHPQVKKLRMHLMQLILTHWTTDAPIYDPLILMDSHEVHPHLVTCQWLSSMIGPIVPSLRLGVVNRPMCIGALGPFHQKIERDPVSSTHSVSSARWWTTNNITYWMQ